jgi:predicted dehydrogenase
MNAAEVELMIQTAKECDRLLVEAVWARWHPRMMRAIELVKSGEIGNVVSIDASFTFPASIEGNYRLSPEMGGGALFDIGVYPLHAIAAIVGDSANIEIKNCETNLGPTGIDLTTKWQMKINDSVTANALASFEMPENQSLVIKGKKQTITFVGSQAFTSWNSASTLQIGDATEEFEAVDPYRVMIENFGKKIQKEESWVLPLETSLWVQRVVDQLRSPDTLRKP